MISEISIVCVVRCLANDPSCSAELRAFFHLKELPDDHRAHSSLGIAYAGSGRIDDAIRAGKRGIELFDVDKDAIIGPSRHVDMATIFTMVGETDEAI